MSMSAGSKGGVKNEINVTPLVDVVLVLLIIFMVVTPAIVAGFNAQLPYGAHLKARPEKDAVVKAAFSSDIGVDNEALRTGTGYVWYDVTGIEAPREKNLDEVRDQVATQWREDQVAQRLSEKANQLSARIEKGEPIEAVAQEAGTSVKNAVDLARNTAKDDLAAEAVNRIFAVPVGKTGNAANGTDARAVFKVTSATVPPLITTTQAAQNAENQLRSGFGDDLISQYIAQVRQDLGVTINQQALRRATGGES